MCPEMEIECCLCGSMEMNNLVCAEIPHYLFHLKTSQSPAVAVPMPTSEKKSGIDHKISETSVLKVRRIEIPLEAGAGPIGKLMGTSLVGCRSGI